MVETWFVKIIKLRWRKNVLFAIVNCHVRTMNCCLRYCFIFNHSFTNIVCVTHLNSTRVDVHVKYTVRTSSMRDDPVLRYAYIL